MNCYRYLDASFWCKDTEYELHPIEIDEYDDYIEIVSYLRDPDVYRGCIGNLILTAIDGRDIEGEEVASTQRDCYRNVLLSKIQVYSAKNREEAPTWKYTFLKD
jgi:hypothetical protein